MRPFPSGTAALFLAAVLLTGTGTAVSASPSPVPDRRADRPATRATPVTLVTRAPTAARRDGEPEVKRLHDDVIHPGADHRTAARRIRTWPGRTIRYHETIPGGWDWSLQDAVNRWNRTGSRIKLVKVTSPGRAQLRIRYGDTGGADGVGTLGYAPGHNIVFLSAAYKRVDQHDPEQRAWVSRLFAHEIGHNLGYVHTRAACSLMVPVFQFGPCGPLSVGKPGYHRCGYIDAPLLRRHIDVYGGRAAPQPTDCLLAPLPPQLADVTAGGGGAVGPVTLRWRTVRPPAGARLRVAVWQAEACGGVPASARSYELPITATTWVDPDVGRGAWCYAVAVRNRYGAEQVPVVRQQTRHLPTPVQPDVIVTYVARAGAYDVTWAPARGLELLVAQDYTDSGRCNLDPDDAYGLGADGVVYPRRIDECLTFYTANQLGDLSGPRQVEVAVPAPAATLTIGAITQATSPDGTGMRATITGAAGERVGLMSSTGACEPEAELYLADDDPLGPDVYGFDLGREGPHCLYAATVDPFGRHGPVATKSFVATFPPITTTPTVGTVAGTDDPYTYRAPASLPDTAPPSLSLAAEVLPGACPGAVPPGLFYDDAYLDGAALVLLAPGGDGVHCALVTSVNYTYDAAGDPRHGPVVKRAFTVEGTD